MSIGDRERGLVFVVVRCLPTRSCGHFSKEQSILSIISLTAQVGGTQAKDVRETLGCHAIGILQGIGSRAE